MKISSLHSCNDHMAMRMKARMCGNLKGGFYRHVCMEITDADSLQAFLEPDTTVNP